jgi:type II secretory ATPase GspE/PulE/Tfp pilus assembly ATPase PilB-like protein
MLNKIRDGKQGVFIISGPKKSGVTTTFYALLRQHDAFLNSIDVLERQPTADLPNINQITFSLSDTGTTTFAKRLLSLVRMGPDIIGVAGCNDSESAKISAQASEDNRIVYVTLEADSVVTALGKWIKLVGDKKLAVETLIGISNQRLVRNLCGECRAAYSPNSGLLRKFNLSSEKVKVLYRPGKVVYDKRGREKTCPNCQGTGFYGRTGIFELIMLNEKLKEAIKPLNTLTEIGTQLRHAKMLYLQERALKRVIDGTTAVNEMIRSISASKTKVTKK